MKRKPIRAVDEAARLRALRSCGLRRGHPDPALDDLIEVAAKALGAPIALASLVEDDHQWFAARTGLEQECTSREVSFCSWAIRTPEDLFVVHDTHLDPRFAENAFVTGPPGIRFYAGAPIRTSNGQALGTLCVLDTQPRAGLAPAEERMLRGLARQVERHLTLLAVTDELALAHVRAHALIEHAAEVVLVLDTTGCISYANAAAGQLVGTRPDALVGSTLASLLHPAAANAEVAQLLSGDRDRADLRVRQGGMAYRTLSAVVSDRRGDARIEGLVLHLRDVTERRAHARRLRESEAQLRQAEQLADMGCWRTDLLSGTMTWSAGLCAVLGVDPLAVEPGPEAWTRLIHPDDLAMVHDSMRVLEQGLPLPAHHLRIVRPDGQTRTMLAHLHVELMAGVAVAVVGTMRDVTDQVAAERALESERTFLRAVLDNLAEGVVACDAEGVLTLFNPAAERFHRQAVEPVAIDGWASRYDLYEPDGITPLSVDRIPLNRALRGEVVREQDMVIMPKGGPPRIVTCTGQLITDDFGVPLGAVVTMHDVTAHRRTEQALRHLADHDLLTDLPNRGVLARRLELALLGPATERLLLLFLDLDRFKAVNDAHGHSAGDEVLVAVAARLRAAMKDNDLVARHGGDEFVVLCQDVDPSDASAIAERLRAAIASPVRVAGHLVTPGVSIGWSCPADAPGATAAQLLLEADHAMYGRKPR